jgi:hypothetical protein
MPTLELRSPENPEALTLLGRLRETAQDFLQPVEFRLVQSRQDLEAALRLVYDEYLKRGYAKPNAQRLKLSLHHALPTTTTFIALRHHTQLLATLTVIEDSPLQLPMDEIYHEELDELRRQGRHLVEATLLALNTEMFGRGVFTMFHAKKLLLTLRLFKVMFDYLRSCTKADDLVACFNPKHAILYDFLELKPLGGQKPYAGANGHPALAARLNIAETKARATWHTAYGFFYGKMPSPQPFAKRLRLSAEDLRELFVLTSDLLTSAGPAELSHLASCYPSYDFSLIRQIV